MEWKKEIAQEMVLYQTKATPVEVQQILVRHHSVRNCNLFYCVD